MDVLVHVGTSDSRGILQRGPYHCGVGLRLDFWGTLPEVPSREPLCPVSPGCYIFNMGGPGVTADGYARVFAVTEVINCVGLRVTVIINCETAYD